MEVSHLILILESPVHLSKIYKESQTLKRLNHKNIVKLKGSFPLRERMSLVLVMEYCSGGELKGYLKKRGRLDENETADIMVQLLSAVSYCHDKRIIHRDLKLGNIVFAKPNSKDIRIVDFGISGLLSTEKSCAGSLRYMAPEILTGKKTLADTAIDIYSLGIILFALVYGKVPFEDKNANVLTQKIIDNKYIFPPKILVSEEC